MHATAESGEGGGASGRARMRTLVGRSRSSTALRTPSFSAVLSRPSSSIFVSERPFFSSRLSRPSFSALLRRRMRCTFFSSWGLLTMSLSVLRWERGVERGSAPPIMSVGDAV